eukprot:TRINITY_DN9771_c0_g3_i2.p1 TRINITY_DN9771_c0_g3~~TRINITY_DN9771_c0_g3_i2.p1  ORF type:complete len:181 (+),score=26.34 TRINITY_DN9771_c0_g3_i2:232-774(+)
MKVQSAIAMRTQGKVNLNPGGSSAVMRTYKNQLNSTGWPLRHTVRIFSPQLSQYVHRLIHTENMSVKSAYQLMRKSHNANSLSICGSARAANEGAVQLKWLKPYTNNAESIHSNWKERVSSLPTTNYESARFNIINHANGQNASITKILQSNPKACHRVKGMTEFYDLSLIHISEPTRPY